MLHHILSSRSTSVQNQDEVEEHFTRNTANDSD